MAASKKKAAAYGGESLKIMLGDVELLDLGPADPDRVSKSEKANPVPWTTGGFTTVNVPGYGMIRINLNALGQK